MLRISLAPTGHSSPWRFFLSVAVLASGYMIYFVASEGHLRRGIGSALATLALASVVAVFPPFVIALALWLLYNVLYAKRLITQLVPYALASVVLYALIFPMPVARFIGAEDLADAPAGFAYLIFAVTYSAWASKAPLKTGMFKFATMLLSLPMLGVLLASVEARGRQVPVWTAASSDHRRARAARRTRERANVRDDVNAIAFMRAMPEVAREVHAADVIDVLPVEIATTGPHALTIDSMLSPASARSGSASIAHASAGNTVQDVTFSVRPR
ncbi:hypothetical protein [Paraburkholderia sp.]|uniref:hypothetical protein n=1 Tax=Paraburkholderia sp. TaxID=1926495 RepID=UPI002391D7F7|nr:hypothetical protein [Paraburkholderia sp.]MDE1179010.1 hypothetical protein [Paraburkholderia sp.]